MSKKAYFLSDLHLGASYGTDSREREKKVVRFLDSIADDACEIYLLGDVLDYWFEYKFVVPKGYVRFLGKIAELSDRGIKITWLIGNHDIWIFDYFSLELGVEIVDGILKRDIMGTTILMEHGDGIWQRDWKFRFLRSLFRNRLCQKLYSGIHPRWTIPFALNWSHNSRISGKRDGNHGPENELPAKQHRLEENIEALKLFSTDYLISDPKVKYFIYGHLHEVLEYPLTQDSKMLILGDWLTHFSYAEFDGKEMRIRFFNE